MTKYLDGLMAWDLKISLSSAQIATASIISAAFLAYNFQDSFFYISGCMTIFFGNETELS